MCKLTLEDVQVCNSGHAEINPMCKLTLEDVQVCNSGHAET